MIGNRHLSLFMLFLVLFNTSVVMAQSSVIRDWQPAFKQYNQDIFTSPESVLSALKNNMPEKNLSSLQKAQRHLLLSKSYHALSVAEEAVKQANISISLINSDNQPWLFHKAQLALSKALHISGDPGNGLIGANAAIVWGEINQDVQLVIDALFVRGVLLNSLADYQGAIRDLQRAHDLASRDGNNIHIGLIAGALASVYEFRKEYDQAIPYFKEAVSHNRSASDLKELSLSLFGLGKANKNIGNTEAAKQQLTESLILAQQNDDEQGVAYALVELADIEKQFKNYSTSLSLLEQALAIFSKSQNQSMLVASYEKMVLLALAMGNTRLANDNLIKAKQLVNPTGMPLRTISLQETAAELMYKQGKYQAAFELLESTLAEKEKVLSQQNSKQLHSLRSQYEIEVKERKNELLEQQNRSQQSNLYQAKTANSQLMLLFGSTLIICVLMAMMAFKAKQHRKRLEEYANTDGLTGLLNRRRALEMIELQFDLAKRHKYPISMAIADIDLFKKLNDTYGHALGDKVLIALGELCKSTFRNTDIVGRIGGEEFIIVLPHTSVNDAEITLKNLTAKFKELASTLKIDKLSISCGLAEFEPDLTITDIMLKCDQALYNAKNQGRDKVLKYKTLHSNVLESYGESSAL